MFQEAFKYYKARNPPPSFENVVDLCRSDSDGLDHRLKIITPSSTVDRIHPGLIPSREWHMYELDDHPGLLIIANPFTKHGQRYWMTRCLRDYPKYPNRTNLPSTVLEKYSTKTDASNDQGAHFDWWTTAQTIEDPQQRAKLWKAFRWTTLGYHYDWTNKIYDEAVRNEFPSDLATMCQHVAEVLGFDNFHPEAAIVNYYPTGSTLAGHTDHSEKNLQAPLFSFSFGQPAIFLIGGPTRDEKPDALLLRSGDVIVMTAASRLCYHAVPKVFSCAESGRQRWVAEIENEPEVLVQPGDPYSSSIWNDCHHHQRCWSTNGLADYISNCRININIRQVLNEGENHL